MLTFIEGLPEDVLGIEAVGNVTHEDYRDILIPRAEAMIGQGADQDALSRGRAIHRLRA